MLFGGNGKVEVQGDAHEIVATCRFVESEQIDAMYLLWACLVSLYACVRVLQFKFVITDLVSMYFMGVEDFVYDCAVVLYVFIHGV